MPHDTLVASTMALRGWPQAKIAIPHPRVVVRRERLISRLGSALTSGRNALVVAPGGSGKSTLVAGWAAYAPIPVAWYSLDLADRDPRRLLSGICAALELAIPGRAVEAQEQLTQGSSEIAVLDHLLGALEALPVALILDDFHQVDGADEISSLFEHLFRFRPAGLALAILSRTIPLLGLAGLTAIDAVIGLGQRDLRFDLSESQALLKAHSLATTDVSQHLRRSGGWAAGLLLLGRTGEGHLHPLRESSERMLERLCSEVIAALPPSQRTFLLESAALGPITPEAADAILGRQNSRFYFSELVASGLFIEQHGDSYRYHDLFAEYLLRIFAQENSAALSAIQEAAAQWWIARGDVPAALALLAAGRQWASLAAVLDREHATLWARGLWGTILDHLGRLPSAFQTSRLLALGGFAHGVRGEHTQALELAERGKGMSSDPATWLTPALLAVQALTLSSHYDEALKAVVEALPVAIEIGRPNALAHLYEMAGVARCRLGQSGGEDLKRAIAIYEQAGDRDNTMRSRFQLGSLLLEAGQAQTAALYLGEAAAYWETIGNHSLLANVANSQALLHLLSGDLVAAYSAASQARDKARAASYPMIEVAALATLAEIAADGGRFTDVDWAAADALADATRLGLGNSANAARRAQITVLLARRDRAGARRLIDAARATVITPVDAALLDLADGQLALRSLAHARAVTLLTTARAELATLDRPHQAARASLYLAEAHLRLGHVVQATAALNRMAGLVDGLGSEGYLLPCAALVPQALAQRRSLRQLHRRARLLLDRIAGSPSDAATPPKPPDAGRPALRISPFGQGAAWLDGAPLDLGALRPKARELLFYSAHVGVDLPRDSLLEAVWAGDAGAVPALWNAGRDLRRLLGERSWGPRGGRYGLRTAVEDEGSRFAELAAVAQGDGPAPERLAAAERALGLLGDGQYLPWCEGEWATAAREQYTALGLRAATAAAHLAAEAGQPEAALAIARRAITIDPLAEEPRILLIGLLVGQGQRGQAREEYTAYGRLLEEELGEAPGPALLALLAD